MYLYLPASVGVCAVNDIIPGRRTLHLARSRGCLQTNVSCSPTHTAALGDVSWASGHITYYCHEASKDIATYDNTSCEQLTRTTEM